MLEVVTTQLVEIIRIKQSGGVEMVTQEVKVLVTRQAITSMSKQTLAQMLKISLEES